MRGFKFQLVEEASGCIVLYLSRLLDFLAITIRIVHLPTPYIHLVISPLFGVVQDVA